ncbi:hypothetical protein, partial [Stenotrophomonas maltophilia]|uniref:hypothetical protein n=1 Tax=Stenotrophomonas maltophilia TaxID=40324 RepID=UPI001FA72851
GPPPGNRVDPTTQGCRPAAGTTGASTQRFGHGAEDLLHLQRLEQAADALPRFPWETAER